MVQDDEVGDGTTSVTVLACELLKVIQRWKREMKLTIDFLCFSSVVQEAEKLVSHKVHPQTIIAGWRKAVDCARKALVESAKDNGANEEKFREVS